MRLAHCVLFAYVISIVRKVGAYVHSAPDWHTATFSAGLLFIYALLNVLLYSAFFLLYGCVMFLQ